MKRKKEVFNIDIEFGKCGEEHGVWAVFKCQQEVKAMHDRFGKW